MRSGAGRQFLRFTIGAILLVSAAGWRADTRPRPEDPKEGVRIERVEGETRIEPIDPSRCRVIYKYLVDLGGKFPAWAQEKAWKEEPVQYMRALRRRLGLPDPAIDFFAVHVPQSPSLPVTQSDSTVRYSSSQWTPSPSKSSISESSSQSSSSRSPSTSRRTPGRR